MPEPFPDCLDVEIEDRADGGEGEAVVSVREHPLPRLMPMASAGSRVSIASVVPQRLEGILKDGEGEALQPTVCRRADNLHG
jgi:hypothetical protein